MKLHKLYLIAGFSVASMMPFMSCSDFLKEEPYTFVGPGEVGNDDSAVNLWVTGVYSKWCNDMFRWDNFPRVLEMDCDYATGPDWAFSKLGAGNFQGDETVDAIWKGCYNLINRANLAIQYVSEITGASERVKTNGLGELYFQKAFAYFMLTQAYGEIPLFDTAVSNGASYNQPRRSISDVYAEIIRLLKDAAGMLNKNTDAGYQSGHVAAGAAAGLLAKVYATMASGAMPTGTEMDVRSGNAYDYIPSGSDFVQQLTLPVKMKFYKKHVAGYENFNSIECYAKAIEWAEKVIDGEYGSYELLDYSQLWKRESYNMTENAEHMFMLQSKSGDEEYGNHIHRYFCGTENANGAISQGQWIGNRYHWYCLFDKTDKRITDGVKHRFVYPDQEAYNGGFYYPYTEEYTIMATGKDFNGNWVADPVAPYNDGLFYSYSTDSRCLAFTTKYADVTDPTQDRTDATWPFLRYADVLLVYAEAQCELASSLTDEHAKAAISKLNDVRRRSGAATAVAEQGGLDELVDLRSAIFEERAKEFAMEGIRRWDLIRWGIYLDVMNSVSGTTNMGITSYYDEAGIYKSRESKHLLFPLPSSEVSTNEAIDGNNPGWS